MGFCCNVGPGPAAYCLRTLTGYKCHDFTKDRAPRYTMVGKNYPPKPCPFGPGPAHCIRRLTRFGGPCPQGWTFPRKYPPPKKDCVPGPKYCCKWAYPREPHYSMQMKYPPPKVIPTPGPADYCISRKPKRCPAFTMQRKYKTPCPPKTPGPADYCIPKLPIYKTREPHYTMISKAYPKQPQVCSPGPAAYCAKLPKKCMKGYAFAHRDQCIDVYYTPEDKRPACKEFRPCCY